MLFICHQRFIYFICYVTGGREIVGILSPPDRAEMEKRNYSECTREEVAVINTEWHFINSHIKFISGRRKMSRKIQQLNTTPRNLSLHGAAPTDYTLVEDCDIPVLNPSTEEELLVSK